MPTLNWIGKDAVVKHHKDVSFRLLEPVPDLPCGPADSGNLIVKDDNLHALKALLPRYAGQVKASTSPLQHREVLTGPVFDMLPRLAGPKVIYAAANRMGSRTAREGVAFKQTPYAVEV